MKTKEEDARIDIVLAEVRAELIKARKRLPAFNSAHEGYAVILEEVDELWDDVKKEQTVSVAFEAVKIAAMAARFILDLCPSIVEEWQENT